MIDFRKPPARGAYDYLLADLDPAVRGDPPPPPPERGGGSRVHVQIDLHPVAAAPRRRRFSTLRVIGALLILMWLLGTLGGCTSLYAARDAINRSTGYADPVASPAPETCAMWASADTDSRCVKWFRCVNGNCEAYFRSQQDAILAQARLTQETDDKRQAAARIAQFWHDHPQRAAELTACGQSPDRPFGYGGMYDGATLPDGRVLCIWHRP